VNDERPAPIFETEIGDAEVDLVLEGSWRSGISGSLGWAVADTGELQFPYTFPGMAGAPFYNVVDLSLSLWLYEQYYLETSVTNDVELNSFMFGYQGEPGELVQSVRIGNGPFSISEYPYQRAGTSTENYPGFDARFATESSEHELMLRLEQSSLEQQTYYGYNRVTQRRISAADYVTDTYFAFPDQDVANLRIYVEDREGNLQGSDGRTYRGVDPAELGSYSAALGYLSLDEPADGRILIYYSKDGQPIGSPGIGTDALVADTDGDGYPDPPARSDFSWSRTGYLASGGFPGIDFSELRVTVEGNQALLLNRLGAYDPFELANGYSIPKEFSQGEATVRLVESGTTQAALSDERSARITDEGAIRIQAGDKGVASPAVRYPFAGTTPGYPRLYGPQRVGSGDYANVEILAEQVEPVPELTVPDEAVPGTVTVYRNGAVDPGFTVDWETGIVSSARAISPADVIRITYRTHNGGADTLVATFGNRIALGENASLLLALGTRWSLPATTYTTAPGQAAGTLTGSAAYERTGERGRFSVEAAVRVTNPDASGVLRVLGMEEDSVTVPISPESFLPSAVPSPHPNLPSSATTAADRGIQHFTDYFTAQGAGGFVLREYGSSLPEDNQYPYEDGSRIGPSVAASSEEESRGRVGVLEFELQDGQWAGAQLPIRQEELGDISTASSISFRWRVPEFNGDVPESYVQIGRLSEDLDDDGTLDENRSTFAPGISFDDEARGITLRAGSTNPGSGALITEDVNGNGTLDSEEPASVITSADLSASHGWPSSEWQRVRIELSPAERSRLASASALRLLVADRTGGNDASGTLLVSDIRIEGSSLYREREEGSLSLRQVPDEPEGGEPLADAFPDAVGQRFFSDGGTAQRVLEAQWSAGGSDRWTARTSVHVLPLDSYERLSFFLRVDPAELSGEAPSLALSLSEQPDTVPSPSDHAVYGEVPLSGEPIGDGAWHMVTLDLATEKLLVDGEQVGTITAERADRPGFVHFTVTEAESGRIYVDELHLHEPSLLYGGAVRSSGEWRSDMTLLSFGGQEIASNPRASYNAELRTTGFTPALAPGEPGGDSGASADGIFTTQSTLGANVLGAGVTARIGVEQELAENDPDTALSLGHTIQAPTRSSPLSVTEEFDRSFLAAAPALRRNNGVAFEAGVLRSAAMQTAATYSGTDLVQSWSGEIELVPGNGRSETTLELNESSRGYELPESGYFESWARSYRLAAPYREGPIVEREALATQTLLYTAGRIEPELSLQAETLNERQGEPRQTNRGAIELSLPIRFGTGPARELVVTPSYSKPWDHVMDGGEQRRFVYDFGRFGEDIAERTYPLVAPVYAELWLPETKRLFAEESRGLPEAEYAPEAAVELQRGHGSRLVDLFLPHTVELSQGRTLTRGGEAVTDERRTGLTLSTAAINLFGTQGAYPRVSLYRSDEFSRTLELQYSRILPVQESELELSRRSSVLFFGAGERELRLSSSWSGTFLDDSHHTLSGIAEYIWLTDVSPRRLPAFMRVDEPELRHTESIQAGAENIGADQGTAQVTVTLRHETSLVLEESGSIRAYVGVGIGRERFPLSAERQTLLGVQAGIEGVLQF
jgi:hypothetical protein